MRAVVLSDTHIRPGRNRNLPVAVYAALAEADVILHAGDVVTRDLLDELSGFAPVHAVLGNNDHGLVGELPESIELELGGVRVAMVHDSGATAGRPRRMHRRFPDAAIVVYGHSHVPFDGPGEGGQRLFNTGSPTERRAQPRHSFGRFELDGGTVAPRLVYL
jgi:putative phosphoesterase